MKDKLDEISFKELVGYSIEGEKSAHDAYMKLSDKLSGLPADRFESLAKDETKHKERLLKLHEDEFGDRNYVVPEKEDLPPHEGDFIEIEAEEVKALTRALDSAIEAETNAYRVYMHLAKENEQYSEIFKYIAMMEKGHKESLEEEKKSIWENYVEKKDKGRSVKELDMWVS